MQYWAVIDNERKGPITFEELKEIGITPSTLVWKEGLENWVSAKDVEELAPLFEEIPLPAPSDPAPSVPEPEQEPESAPAPEATTSNEWQSGFSAGWAAAINSGNNSQQQPQPQQPAPFSQPQQPVSDCPPTYLWLAITVLVVMTLCCCNPFGLIAIVPLVYATKVKSAYEMGDVENAKSYSSKALYWSIGTIFISIVLGIIYFIVNLFVSYPVNLLNI